MALYPYNAEEGQTDLMAAAFNGDADEVGRLVALPCDLDAQDAHGMTALMYAALRGHADVTCSLVEAGSDLELQSHQKFSALMYAVRNGDSRCVQALLVAGANPNVHGNYDMVDTPLIIAARQGSFEIVRALVAARADVSAYGGIAGLTAECEARRAGHHSISEFLCYNEKRVYGGRSE